ncbi:MAG: hypothetical protein ACOYD1_13690, partial [Candidatus Nanopelagicales bacterium]
MPEIEGSEKRQGLHLAHLRSAAVESKENSPARTPKMAANCESQANRSLDPHELNQGPRRSKISTQSANVVWIGACNSTVAAPPDDLAEC